MVNLPDLLNYSIPNTQMGQMGIQGSPNQGNFGGPLPPQPVGQPSGQPVTPPWAQSQGQGQPMQNTGWLPGQGMPPWAQGQGQQMQQNPFMNGQYQSPYQFGQRPQQSFNQMPSYPMYPWAQSNFYNPQSV